MDANWLCSLFSHCNDTIFKDYLQEVKCKLHWEQDTQAA